MSYLHGIEIKEGAKRAILSAGDTSVIALVGTAPKGAVNQIKLFNNLDSAQAEYGDDISGFTIPSALATIFATINAKVLVLNVLSTEKATVLLEDGKMTRNEDGVPVTTLYGSQLAEAVDYTTDILKGLESLTKVDDALGVKPNIIIVPGYSGIASVASKMIAVAEKLEGFAVIDVVADNVQAALTARANGAYNLTSQAAVLCYPQILRYNEHEGINDVIGLSVHWATSKSLRDTKEGYWLSPSNTELNAVMGLTAEVSSSLTDPAADSNLLNGQGIVTVFRKSGMGSRLWGNWTAAFPTFKTPDCMIAPRAVRMAIREALVKSALTYMDKGATGITIDMIMGDVNAFIRNLIGQGAIIDGVCSWNPDKNPAENIAMGHLTFTLSIQYTPSLERLTFEEVVEF